MEQNPSVFEAVAAPRRQAVCRYMEATGDADATLGDVTTFVETDERGESERAVRDDGFTRRVRIDLHHAHLPKLADADVVQYDHQQQRVRAGANLQVAIELVETRQRHTEVTGYAP